METQTAPILFAIIGIAASLMFTFFVVRYALKKQRESLERLASGLPSATVVGGMTMRIESQLEGRMFHLSPQSGGKNQPPQLKVLLVSTCSFQLSISEEGAGTRFLKNLGLLKEIKVGDPTFDTRFLVRSRDEGQASSLLSDSRMREAVTTIFDQGFFQLAVNAKGLHAVRVVKNWDDGADAQSVRTVMEKLVVLARGVGA